MALPYQCDMSHLMNMRKAYKEDFEKKHGIKLGFMSCFVKASADALREMPAVNGCKYRTLFLLGFMVTEERWGRGSSTSTFAGIILIDTG